jgi:hypothetical protein
MKINENFVLRQVVDTYVVFPIGKATVDFNGMVTLNETGAFLWRCLEQGATRETLADALTGEYDVSREDALADIDAFLASLAPVGCIED